MNPMVHTGDSSNIANYGDSACSERTGGDMNRRTRRRVAILTQAENRLADRTARLVQIQAAQQRGTVSEDPPGMCAAQFTVRFMDDGMWTSSSHVAYFETPAERDAFCNQPFVLGFRYPDDDVYEGTEDYSDV